MSLLIRGGRVVDPANRVDREADVLIEGERVSRIGKGIVGAQLVIDATDRLVVPGLVDIHVHLREPGQTHKEDIGSGSAAAAAGGFATVCCMPNTSPPNDAPEVTQLILRRVAQAGVGVRVCPVGAITRGLQGRELCDFKALKAAGAVAVSDDGRCVVDDEVMRRALQNAAAAGMVLIQHCEDHRASGGGAMNEGPASRRAGISGQPAAAESDMVARDLELLGKTGGRYHVAHVSTAASVSHLRRAKAAGLPVTCEVTPHHFSLTDEACLGRDTATKVNPPLRGAEDVAAVREGIADGTVDLIATDHAPHAVEEKAQDYESAPFGISGLETAVPLCLALWREGLVSLERIVAMLSCSPARALGLGAGVLHEGGTADVTVIDPERPWVVDPARLLSRGRNTPFAGQRVQGVVTHTVVAGRLVWDHDCR